MVFLPLPLGVEMGLTSKDADPKASGTWWLLWSAMLEWVWFLIDRFDADCATNKAVIEAQQPAHQLKLF